MKQPINNRSTISSVNPSPNLVALSQSNPEHNYYNNIDLGAAGAYSNAFVEDAINFYYSNGQTKFAVQTGTDKKGNPLYTTTDLGGLEKTVNSIKDENLRMAALGNMPGTLNYNNGNTNLNISPASRRSLGKESYYDKQDIGSFGALMGRMNPLQVDPNSLKMQPVNTVSLKGPSKSNPVPEGRGTQSCGPDGCIWQNAYGGPLFNNKMKNTNQYMFGGLAAGLASALGANETITNVAGLAGSGLGMLVNPLSGLQGAKYATGLLGEGLGNSKNSFAMGGDITKFTGPSHEQGGIAIGQNVEVEGGELMTPSKIVMSDRLGPNGKKGPTYAELAEKLRKRKEKRPGDKLSAEAVDREIAALEQLQESDPNILAAREKSNKQMMALGGPLEEDPINPQAFASLFGNNPSNALNYLNPEQTQQALSHLTSIFPQLEKNKDQYATRLEDYQANMGSTPFTGLVGMGAQSRADDASGAANKANMAANALNAVGGFNNATRPFQTPFNNNNMELVQPIAPYEIGTMLDSQGNSNYRHPGFINRDPAILSNRTNLDKPLPGEFDEFVPRPNVKIKDFKGSPGTTIPYGEDTSSVTTDWYNNIDTFNKNNPENNAQVNTLDSVKPNPWGYAAQAIGPLAQGLYAALTPAENTQFERINPAMMNLDPARQGMRRNASLSQANARRMNAGARTVGANIAANTASNVGISRGLQDGFLNSYLQENMYNTNATNQARQANASIAMQERDANDRNEAQRRNMIFNSIGNLGTGLAAGLSENTALQAQELMNQRYLNMANSMFSNYIMSPDGTVQFRS